MLMSDFFSTDNQSPRKPKKVPDVYTIFRPPYWCARVVHQYGVFILGSVNFYETFLRISEV